MAKIAASAVIESIKSLASVGLTTNQASELEAFLVAKRLEARSETPTIEATNGVVDELFVIFPEDAEGRIRPFLATHVGSPQWAATKDSGRKTVWNVSTRNNRVARQLFNSKGGEAHIKNGWHPDALENLSTVLGNKKPDRLALTIFFTWDQDFQEPISEADIEQRFSDMFGIDPVSLDAIATATSLTVNLADTPEWSGDELPESMRAAAAAGSVEGDSASQEVATGLNDWIDTALEDEEEVLVPSRIRQMILTAIAAHRAVVLVGPPGTGKSRLLEQIVAEIASAPESFGFSSPINEPLWATPDEGWTTRDLLGGDTIINNSIRFTPGIILRAISSNRWVVLDELNRADMDRIFGGLFTWLSGKKVTVGRVTPEHNSAEVELSWTINAAGRVIGEELFAPSHAGSAATALTYEAGTEWRLLATYNAADVHRVFRLGQALSRRFVRIPIPPPSEALFVSILNKGAKGLPQNFLDRITKLYAAHLQVEPLGPAIFLAMPKYLSAALGQISTTAAEAPLEASTQESLPTGETVKGESSGIISEGARATDAASGGSSATPVPPITDPNITEAAMAEVPLPAGGGNEETPSESRLLAEAYLISAGHWLAALEDDKRADLRTIVVDNDKILDDKDWEWLMEMLPAMG